MRNDGKLRFWGSGMTVNEVLRLEKRIQNFGRARKRSLFNMASVEQVAHAMDNWLVEENAALEKELRARKLKLEELEMKLRIMKELQIGLADAIHIQGLQLDEAAPQRRLTFRLVREDGMIGVQELWNPEVVEPLGFEDDTESDDELMEMMFEATAEL